MKQKIFKKLACLALSGILSVSGVEIPAYASESLIINGNTEIQTETTAEGTTETSGESAEPEVVPTQTSNESTETEVVPTETEIIPTETPDESTETEIIPAETSDESTESETMEEETTETATDEETMETETEMAEKMTARAADEGGDVPTPQEVYDAMIALQSDFPEGMPWTDASSGTYT